MAERGTLQDGNRQHGRAGLRRKGIHFVNDRNRRESKRRKNQRGEDSPAGADRKSDTAEPGHTAGRRRRNIDKSQADRQIRIGNTDQGRTARPEQQDRQVWSQETFRLCGRRERKDPGSVFRALRETGNQAGRNGHGRQLLQIRH